MPGPPPPARRRHVLAALLLALVALGAHTWLSDTPLAPAPPSTPPPSPTAPATVAAPPVATLTSTPTLEAPAPSAPRSAAPPPAKTLRDAYPDLARRADAGDTQAQCVLGIELGRCAAVAAHRRALDREVAQAAQAARGSAEEARHLVAAKALQSDLDPVEAYCAGMESIDAPAPWRFLLAAAQGGDTAAMVTFAAHPPLDEATFTADLDGWKAYRDHAFEFLQRAAERGDPTAVFYLAWGYSAGPMPGGAPLVPRDAMKAVAYARVARRAADAPSALMLDRLIARLQPELSADGDRAANDLAAAYAAAHPFTDTTPRDFAGGGTPDSGRCGR